MERGSIPRWEQNSGVLILVLLEDGLGDEVKKEFYRRQIIVLILVLLEDGLGVFWLVFSLHANLS